VGESWYDLFNSIVDWEVVEAPRVLKFFVKLVATIKAVKFINFIDIIVLCRDLFTGFIFLEDLKASFFRLLIFDEESSVVISLIHVVWCMGPSE